MPRPTSDETTTVGGATIVTQTRPAAGQEEVFKRWQDTIGAEVAKWPCFIDQKVMPPSPPAQIDWVILQRFSSVDAAASWLHSAERLKLVETIQPMLAGTDDIHVVRDGASGVLPAAASAVISTRVKQGQEVSFRRWEQRIAAAQARAPGFQGYRLEPPVPGVQDDWLAIVRFDSDSNLENWLQSPERLKLLKDSEFFTEHLDARRAQRVRSVVLRWKKRRAGTARMEAEHDRSGAALSARVPVRHVRTKTGIDRPYQNALLARPVCGKSCQRGVAELVSPLG
ncbi:MAG: hypothetical protein ACJ74Z_04140 [Bryobacteraceae bacterium]